MPRRCHSESGRPVALTHLERAQHTLGIARGERFGTLRIHFPQLPDEPAQSMGAKVRPQGLAHFRADRRHRRQPFEQRAQVEAAAAHQNRQRPARFDLFHRHRRASRERPGRERLVRLDDVDQVVANPAPLSRSGLRRADRESPIGLQGVGADQLDGEPPSGKVGGQRHRERALAGGGRTKDGDHLPGRRGHGCRLAAVGPGRHPQDRAAAAGTVAAEENLDSAVEVRAKNPDSAVLHP